MFDQDIRWYMLASVAIIVALLQIGLETGGVWFGFPARPDWLWIVAFSSVLRVTPTAALAGFALCGLARDAFLGPELGSAAIAYVLVGWAALSWRTLATERMFPTLPLLAGATAFLAALVRHALDFGPFACTLADRVFFVSVGDGVLTGLAYLPLALILGIPALRPPRET